MKKGTFSRRNFLKVTGAAAGTAALGNLALPQPAAAAHAQAVHGEVNLQRGRMFFTNTLEFATLSSAAERIFPKDESGPGAVELAVPVFIDNQLAGGWGYNAREYMQGPFAPGAPTQGPQTALIRRDLFRQGLKALNDAAQASAGKDFANLDPAAQDQILRQCQAGELATQGFSSAYFFSELRGAVLAGVYADPIYNGNNNMDGWRMKNYPGAHMSYTFLIGSDEFQVIDPISLASML